MADQEIEIQVQISKSKNLVAFLQKHATFKYKSYQKDEYFTPAHRNFIDTSPVNEWLRLREADTNSLTYKNWHHQPDGKSNYCDEFETEISDIAATRKIFAVLDMKTVVKVEKTRQAWHYQDYEIALDHVEDLGDFVEIEYKGDGKSDANEITNEMIALLHKIDCGKIERNYVGYAYMLLNPDETVSVEQV